MKSISRNVVFFSTKISKNLRTILFVVTLIMFVLAAGAPAATGSIGG